MEEKAKRSRKQKPSTSRKPGLPLGLVFHTGPVFHTATIVLKHYIWHSHNERYGDVTDNLCYFLFTGMISGFYFMVTGRVRKKCQVRIVKENKPDKNLKLRSGRPCGKCNNVYL